MVQRAPRLPVGLPSGQGAGCSVMEGSHPAGRASSQRCGPRAWASGGCLGEHSPSAESGQLLPLTKFSRTPGRWDGPWGALALTLRVVCWLTGRVGSHVFLAAPLPPQSPPAMHILGGLCPSPFTLGDNPGLSGSQELGASCTEPVGDLGAEWVGGCDYFTTSSLKKFKDGGQGLGQGPRAGSLRWGVRARSRALHAPLTLLLKGAPAAHPRKPSRGRGAHWRYKGGWRPPSTLATAPVPLPCIRLGVH